jgi:hypothetical protein
MEIFSETSAGDETSKKREQAKQVLNLMSNALSRLLLTSENPIFLTQRN